jgi:uncharacterized protein YneF (UPF0154 family)
MLSFSYYLHEKAEESRHNETVGYLVAIIGSVFFVGGILQTLVTVQRPQWFLIFPYQLGSSPLDFLGLAFTLLGIILFLGGIVLGTYYSSQRSWYCNALKDSYRLEEERLKSITQSQSKQPRLSATEAPTLANVLEPQPESEASSSSENT